MSVGPIHPRLPIPPADVEGPVTPPKGEPISEVESRLKALSHRRGLRGPRLGQRGHESKAQVPRSSPDAKTGHHAPTPAFDGKRFHDQSRLRSSEVTRAFSSVIRAASRGPQSEASEPDEVTIEHDVDTADMEIVRGVD